MKKWIFSFELGSLTNILKQLYLNHGWKKRRTKCEQKHKKTEVCLIEISDSCQTDCSCSNPVLYFKSSNSTSILLVLQQLVRNVYSTRGFSIFVTFKLFLPWNCQVSQTIWVWTLISDHSAPYMFCFYCPATLHATSQVLQPK